MVRGGSEEARDVRNGLLLTASLPPRNQMTSKPGLLPIAISGSVAARVCVDVHDPRCSQSHGFARGVGHHLCPWAVMPPGSCWSDCPIYPVTLGTYSHPAWIGAWSHTSAATRVCADIQGFSDRWKLWGWLGSGRTPKFMLISNRHPSTGAMLIWMVCTIIQGQEGLRGWAAVSIMPRSVTLSQSEFRMGLNWC